MFGITRFYLKYARMGKAIDEDFSNLFFIIKELFTLILTDLTPINFLSQDLNAWFMDR